MRQTYFGRLKVVQQHPLTKCERMNDELPGVSSALHGLYGRGKRSTFPNFVSKLYLKEGYFLSWHFDQASLHYSSTKHDPSFSVALRQL